MAAIVRHAALGASNGPSFGTVTTTVDLVTPTSFVAWGSVTWIDPRAAIRGRDFVALDILFIDGQFPLKILSLPGCDPGQLNIGCLFLGATTGFGRTITFRLRSIPFTGGGDLVAGAEFVIITNP
jgi:hypothetical protein